MAIKYKLDKDGSFSAGDTETGITCYAYPTSEHADDAKKNPHATALEMLAHEAGNRVSWMPRESYDERNWERINAPAAADCESSRQPRAKRTARERRQEQQFKTLTHAAQA